MFRFYNGSSPPLMNSVLKLGKESSYNLRYVSEFSRPMVQNVYQGNKSISYLGSKIWDILPEKLKTIENLDHFIKYVVCVKFVMKVQDFSNFSKAQEFLREFLCRIFILLLDLSILCYSNINMKTLMGLKKICLLCFLYKIVYVQQVF